MSFLDDVRELFRRPGPIREVLDLERRVDAAMHEEQLRQLQLRECRVCGATYTLRLEEQHAAWHRRRGERWPEVEKGGPI